MSINKPIFTSHRKWFSCLFGIIFMGYVIYHWSLIQPAFPLLPDDTEGFFLFALIFFGPVVVMIALGALCIREWWKSRRIEFYEESIKVFTNWKGESLELPYSALELGSTRLWTGSNLNFKLSANIDGKTVSWNIVDGYLPQGDNELLEALTQCFYRRQRKDLFLWLYDKVGKNSFSKSRANKLIQEELKRSR